MLGTLNILLKGIIGVTVMMWVRWTLPRLRIDQVITTCLKYCVPIAALAFLGATWWQYACRTALFFGILQIRRRAMSLRERWPIGRGKRRTAKATSEPADRNAGDHRAAIQNWHIPNELRAMDAPIYWPSFFFLLFAAIACAFAVAVVVSPNIVRMAFYLVLSLAATAGLFFLAGADFVGSMQILIYVGGTLVLLVFGVMLTSQDRFISMKTSRFELGMAARRRACLFILLCVRRLERAGMARPHARPSRRDSSATDRHARRHGPIGRARRCARSIGLPADLRNHFRPLAGRFDRRRLPGPCPPQKEPDSPNDHAHACQFVDRAGRRRALPHRRRGAVRLRRAVHGHEAQRAGRADGHRARAQRREPEFHRLRQPVLANRRRKRSGSTASSCRCS